MRVASDGNWGVAAAFTEPTDRSLEQLRFADFTGAAVLDGNPLRYRAHPEEVVAVPMDGSLVSLRRQRGPCRERGTTPRAASVHQHQ